MITCFKFCFNFAFKFNLRRYTMAGSTASACGGALQLLHPSTHAELLRRGAAAGLAAHLGPGGERKASALLSALTCATDAGYARGAAAVCRALWVEGTADSAAAAVVGRCKLTASKPVLKEYGCSA